MIALDTNILLDLLVSSLPTHVQSVEHLKSLEDEYCTTSTNIAECLRLLSHPKVFPKPLSITKAASALESLVDYYNLRVFGESGDWWKSVSAIEAEIPGLRGKEIFDARIAICLKENGVKKIFTRDADFKKYSFLKVLTHA